MKKPISLNFPDDLIARLDAAAEAEQRSRSNMVRQIVEKHLAEHAKLCAVGSAPVLVAKNAPAPPARLGVESHLRRHAELSAEVLRSGAFDTPFEKED